MLLDINLLINLSLIFSFLTSSWRKAFPLSIFSRRYPTYCFKLSNKMSYQLISKARRIRISDSSKLIKALLEKILDAGIKTIMIN